MHLRKKVHFNLIKYLPKSLPKIDIQNVESCFQRCSHLPILTLSRRSHPGLEMPVLLMIPSSEYSVQACPLSSKLLYLTLDLRYQNLKASKTAPLHTKKNTPAPPPRPLHSIFQLSVKSTTITFSCTRCTG